MSGAGMSKATCMGGCQLVSFHSRGTVDIVLVHHVPLHLCQSTGRLPALHRVMCYLDNPHSQRWGGKDEGRRPRSRSAEGMPRGQWEKALPPSLESSPDLSPQTISVSEYFPRLLTPRGLCENQAFHL